MPHVAPHATAPAATQGYMQLRSGLTMAALSTRSHKLGALDPAARPGEAREHNLAFASPQPRFRALAAHFRQDSA